MKIDWAALGIVAFVSVLASVAFIMLLSSGIRVLSAARLRGRQGGSTAVAASAGYALIGLAGVLVLFGLYLIVPQFN